MNSSFHHAAIKWVLAATLPVAALMLTSCARDVTHAQAATSAASAEHNVAVARVTRQDLRNDLALTAEFRPFQEIDVMAKVSGYVRKIYVDVGSRVNQGDILAELEVPEMRDDLTRADADIQRRTAEVERSKDELRRAESAHQMMHVTFTRLNDVSKSQPGLIAQQEVDDAHSKDLVAEAQVSAAKSALNAAMQELKSTEAGRDRSKTLYAYTRVTAPFAGVITMRYANTGSMIQAGTASNAMPLVKLSQNGLLRLILPVPESAVTSIRVGSPVDVHVPTLDRTFPGRVARFAERVQTATRTMDTEVDVPNSQLVLIPGMFAEVNLGLAQRQQALAAPLTAEAIEGDHTVMYLVNDKHQIEIRRVGTGLQTADAVEIKSGLNEGDLVVIGNRSELREGQRVNPQLVQLSAAVLK